MISKPKSNIIQLMSVVVIILIAFFFGLRGINQYPIIRDELTTLGHIGALTSDPTSIQDTVNSLITYSWEHPPTFYIMLHLWGTYTSFSHVTIFMLTVLLGSLTLSLIYKLGKTLSNHTVGLLAIILMATSVMFLYYLHELRQYMALIFFTGAFWLWYIRLVKTSYSIPIYRLLVLTVITACYIYTHYSSMLFMVSIGIYHLFFVPKSKNWFKISGAIICAGFLFVPWLPNVLASVDRATDILNKGPNNILYNQDLLISVPQFWGNGHYILFLILLVFGLIAVARNQENSRMVLFFCVTVAILFLLLNSQLVFIKRLRYLIYTLIPFYILGGMGLSILVKTKWSTFIIVFLLIWVGVGHQFQYTDEFYNKTALDSNDDWTEYQMLVPFAREQMDTDDLLIIVVRNFKEVKQSKQKQDSPYNYYLEQLDVDRQRIFSSPEVGNFDLEKLLGKLEGRSEFWITYRFEHNTDHMNFLEAIEVDYKLCQHLPYGNESYLEQYVYSLEYDVLCSS
jgi:4-amino-4-deoxy-L-arabinose transferase-like glycosyltransferase